MQTTDAEWVELLRWALPRLRMRWPGFRKVRGQVCKRLRRRMRALGLDSVAAYRERLERDPSEWEVLDAACRISISRFWRDRGAFAFLQDEVLPALVAAALERGRHEIVAWSAGCASGEEPYSLALLWDLALAPRLPRIDLRILATDADAALLGRAGDARYAPGSLKDLPEEWRERAFEPEGDVLALEESHRRGVELRLQDLRTAMPDGPFDLILCRNLAFTYFDPSLQKEILEGLHARLCEGGALVIGSHESLPAVSVPLVPWSDRHRVYRRQAGASSGRATAGRDDGSSFRT